MALTKISHDDNDKAVFGTSEDLQIFHDGSNSYITDAGTGDLIITTVSGAIRPRTDQFTVKNAANNETILYGDANSACALYYDNSKKFETTASGVTAYPALKVDSGSIETYMSYSNGNSTGIIGTESNHSLEVRTNNTERMRITAAGLVGIGITPTARLHVNGVSTADIITARAADTNGNSIINILSEGTTGNSRINFSDTAGIDGQISYNHNSRALIFTAAGTSERLRIDSSGHVVMPLDNQRLKLGDGADLQIYHDGADNILLSNGASCDLLVYVANGELAMKAVPNGAVELYYDNVKKAETNTNGLNVTGRLYCSSHINLDDNSSGSVGKLQLGGGNDLELYHNGSNSYISNTTNLLQLKNSGGNIDLMSWYDVQLRVNAGEMAVDCNHNGSVDLYYNDVKKFETTSGGAKVTGDLTLSDKIIHDGDTNTALRFPADDTFTIEIAGSEIFRADSTHHIGLRTSTVFDSNSINMSGTKAYSGGICQGQVAIYDGQAYNTTDNGGAISFSAKYNSSNSVTQMAAIEGVKQNNTDGNYGGDLIFKTRSHNGNNVERMRLNDGGLRFPSGYGINFSAQTASSQTGASTSSEILDHYEEGSWTATVTGNSALGSVTISSNDCWYTRVGRKVTVCYYINFTSMSGASGHLNIGGLPFTAATNNQFAGSVMTNGLDYPTGATTGSNIVSHTWGGVDYFRFYTSQDDGAWQPVQAQTSGGMIGTMTYFTAS